MISSACFIFGGFSMIGDIAHHTKTTEDEAGEEIIRAYLNQQLYPHIPDTVIAQSEAIIMQLDKQEPTTALFRAVEDLGYYGSGIRAGQVAQNNHSRYVHREHLSDLRLRQVGRMALRVPNVWQTSLQERAAMFPHIEATLAATHTTMRYINQTLLQHMQID